MINSVPRSEFAATLPREVLAVFDQFFTAELTTIGKSGYPVSWPVLPVFEPMSFQFVIFTSIGLVQKAMNIRHDRRVALLYSEPTGSGMSHPPAVLVQGAATAPDTILSSVKSLEPGVLAAIKTQSLRLIRSQPGMRMYLANPLSRYLMDWYFMRQVITVRPQQIYWWPEADFSQNPEKVSVQDVV